MSYKEYHYYADKSSELQFTSPLQCGTDFEHFVALENEGDSGLIVFVG